jgi:transcriptional regulator with XRE-family HTH domain
VSKKNIIYHKIAENIRRTRKDRNITQEALAYEAGLNRAYIGYIERGERKPSVETLEKIAKVLKVRIFELFIFD